MASCSAVRCPPPQVCCVGVRRRVELVLLHSPGRDPSGTLAWLEPRPLLARHHHVRLSHPKVAALPTLNMQRSSSRCEDHRTAPLGEACRLICPPSPCKGRTSQTRRDMRLRSAEHQPDMLLAPLASLEPHFETGWPSSCPVVAAQDVARVARWMAGKAVGLVLSGGGSRGLAHLGVLHALDDAGVPIDVIGGTSQARGVLYCMGLECKSGQVHGGIFCARGWMVESRATREPQGVVMSASGHFRGCRKWDLLLPAGACPQACSSAVSCWMVMRAHAVQGMLSTAAAPATRCPTVYLVLVHCCK